MDIKNKVAIVTGGSGGIGFATIQALLKNEAKHVAIFDKDSSKNSVCLQKLTEQFGSGRASAHTCDVTNPTELSDRFDEVLKSQKKLDILINTCGILDDTQPAQTISINLGGLINSCLAAIDRMGKHKNGQGGTIVNVASIAGLICFPVYPVYVAAKCGIIGFTRSVKGLNSHTGVRAMVLCPGVTATPMIKSVDHLRKITLDVISDEVFDRCKVAHYHEQSTEKVAEAIMKMIKQADNGAVWVCEENEPPYAIKDLPPYRERKIPI